MKLLNSEPFGALVKSTVEVDGKNIEVYHFDLPPDETGIFSVAERLATEPKPVEPKPEPIKPGGGVEPVEAEPVVIPKEKLDAAIAVADKLNALGIVTVVAVKEPIEPIEEPVVKK